MKGFLQIGLIIIILISPDYSQTQRRKLNNFRNFAWGSSPEQIKKSESALLLQTVNGFGEYAMSYSDEFAGRMVRVDYVFIDNSLSSGIYTYKLSGEFKEEFLLFFTHLKKTEGIPDFRAGPEIEQNNPWIKDGNYGMFKGPEFYWQFDNGFIALHSSRYNEKSTISILYVGNQTISEYNKNERVSLDKLN